MTTSAPWSASASTMAMPIPLLPPVTIATLPSSSMVRLLVRWGSGPVRADRLRELLVEVVADADGVGHGGQRRVHGADAREEAGVDHVEVVELVGLAGGVEHGGRRIVAEAAGAGLVGHAGHGDVHVHVEVLVEHVVIGH